LPPDVPMGDGMSCSDQDEQPLWRKETNWTGGLRESKQF
jgi:hypothetical protein